MKQLYFILLFLVLGAGLITVCQEVQPNSRIAENLTKNTIEYSIPSCSFTASTDDFSSSATHSYYYDENSGNWTNIALCPNSSSANNYVSSKILKLKLHLPIGLLQRIYSVRLLAKQNSLLSFNANADRYSNGYYIYALAHILI